MIISPETYYAYSRSCMEKIDSCVAFSRISAARTFADKKQISLKNWLKIYVTYDYNGYSSMYGKNVYFKKNSEKLIQYKVLKGDLLVLQRFNDSDVLPAKAMTRTSFISFMRFMKRCGYIVEIE